jgi:hypothetical protein
MGSVTVAGARKPHSLTMMDLLLFVVVVALLHGVVV